MPRSALSSTLVVGVISFPMDWTKILGVSWPENERQLSHAQAAATVPAVIQCCLLIALCCSHRPCVGSHQPGRFRVGGTGVSTSEEILAPTAFCPLELTQSPGTNPSDSFFSISFLFLSIAADNIVLVSGVQNSG